MPKNPSGKPKDKAKLKAKARNNKKKSNKENEDPKSKKDQDDRDAPSSAKDASSTQAHSVAHSLDNYKPEHPTKVTVRNLPPRLSEELFLTRIRTKHLPDYNYFNFCPPDQSLHPWGTAQAYINFVDPAACEPFYHNWNGFDFSVDVPPEEDPEAEADGAEEGEPLTEEDAQRHIVDATNDQNEFVHVEGLHLLNLKDKKSVNLSPESYMCFVEVSKFQKVPAKASTYKIGESSLEADEIKKELGYSGKIFQSAEFKHFCKKFEPASETPAAANEASEGKDAGDAPAAATPADNRTQQQQKLDLMMQLMEKRKKEVENKTTKKSTLVLELEKAHEEERKKRKGNLKVLEERRKQKKREEEKDRKYEEFKKSRGIESKGKGKNDGNSKAKDRKKQAQEAKNAKNNNSNANDDKTKDSQGQNQNQNQSSSGKKNNNKKPPRIRKREDKEKGPNDHPDKEASGPIIVNNKKSQSKSDAIKDLLGSDVYRDGKVKEKKSANEGQTAPGSGEPNGEAESNKQKNENKRKLRREKEKLAKQARQKEQREAEGKMDRSERIDRAKRPDPGPSGTGPGPSTGFEDGAKDEGSSTANKPQKNRNRNRNRNRGPGKESTYVDEHDRR